MQFNIWSIWVGLHSLKLNACQRNVSSALIRHAAHFHIKTYSHIGTSGSKFDWNCGIFQWNPSFKCIPFTTNCRECSQLGLKNSQIVITRFKIKFGCYLAFSMSIFRTFQSRPTVLVVEIIAGLWGSHMSDEVIRIPVKPNSPLESTLNAKYLGENYIFWISIWNHFGKDEFSKIQVS